MYFVFGLIYLDSYVRYYSVLGLQTFLNFLDTFWPFLILIKIQKIFENIYLEGIYEKIGANLDETLEFVNNVNDNTKDCYNDW